MDVHRLQHRQHGADRDRGHRRSRRRRFVSFGDTGCGRTDGVHRERHRDARPVREHGRGGGDRPGRQPGVRHRSLALLRGRVRDRRRRSTRTERTPTLRPDPWSPSVGPSPGRTSSATPATSRSSRSHWWTTAASHRMLVGGGDEQLDPRETWTYSATGIATAGQYGNTATVSGLDVLEDPVSDSDPSHYFGPPPVFPQPQPPLPQPAPPAPGGGEVKPIVIVSKRSSHSRVRAGTTVRFTLRVRNAGSVTARSVRVCDRLPSGLAFASARGARIVGRSACFNAGTMRVAAGAHVRRVRARRCDLAPAPDLQRRRAHRERLERSASPRVRAHSADHPTAAGRSHGVRRTRGDGARRGGPGGRRRAEFGRRVAVGGTTGPRADARRGLGRPHRGARAAAMPAPAAHG